MSFSDEFKKNPLKILTNIDDRPTICTNKVIRQLTRWVDAEWLFRNRILQTRWFCI